MFFFWQNGTTFSYLLIVNAKYDMGREPPAQFVSLNIAVNYSN